MMHPLSTLTSLTLAFTHVIALPTNTGKPKHCVSKNFNDPWVLHDIFVWQPFREPKNSNVTEKGYIDFVFCDSNKGLALVTSCSGDLIDGVTEDKNGGYNVCKNSSVAFKYTAQREILMERAYIDPW